MRNRWQLWVALLTGVLCLHHGAAQEAAVQVTARIVAVKESDWQREMAAGGKPDGLRERLQARTLVELSGELLGEENLILKSGKERDFEIGWYFNREHTGVVAEKTYHEFIGTKIEVANRHADQDVQKTPHLYISLTHDLKEPEMLPRTYASATTGAERESKSVLLPCFHRLTWSGDVVAGPEESLVASFLPDETPGSRVAVFIRSSRGTSTASTDLRPTRQTIYRVPELELIERLFSSPQSDEALERSLRVSVAAGRASIVSEQTSSARLAVRTSSWAGAECWEPTEITTDYNTLYQVPTSLDFRKAGTETEYLAFESETDLHSHFSPRPPLAVPWPISWLRAQDENGVRDKALHGWMEWNDHFEQSIKGTVFPRGAAPLLVSVMPPADQVWGAERQGRWLDATCIQQTGGPAAPWPPPATPQPHRLLLGLSLSTEEAHAMLAKRQPNKDRALLESLLPLIKEGRAQVVVCALASYDSGRRNQTSARDHAYPTEMPSVPSAWGMREVGTRFELEGETLTLSQDLAPPARTEWRLAQDVPEAVMWQPRFRELQLNTTTAAMITSGTHLLAAVNVPELMSSADLRDSHRTILIFSHLAADAAAQLEPRHDFEIETQIFEFPIQDATAWQDVKSKDFETFSQQQVQRGRASLQSHAMLRSYPDRVSTLSLVEEYRTATGFDPPRKQAPLRMRPTALTVLPVGLQLEGTVGEGSDGSVGLSVKLHHSTARPIEPSLEETLRLSADTPVLYPGAKHERDEWEEHISPGLGKFYRLLPPTSTSRDKTTTRSAWVRVRRVK
jgi:hypothetical protein